MNKIEEANKKSHINIVDLLKKIKDVLIGSTDCTITNQSEWIREEIIDLLDRRCEYNNVVKIQVDHKVFINNVKVGKNLSFNGFNFVVVGVDGDTLTLKETD